MTFTGADFRRVAWTFAMAAGGVFLALAAEWFQSGGALNWKAWAIAAVAAGISAVKNATLPEDSALK